MKVFGKFRNDDFLKMKKDIKHIEYIEKINKLLQKGFSIEEISTKLSIPLGTRYEKETAKWYRYCIRAKENQKKAIEKHPNLYAWQVRLLNKNILGLAKN